jgi:AcrR family transcriptional regulator
MTRPMRADARRNYERLLAEARQAFLEHGTGASLEDVARRSAVGIGTLYRHFPTRDALLEAVVRDRFDGLSTRAAELLEAPSPIGALHEWLRAFIAGVNHYRGLTATVMTTLQDETSELHASCEAMRAGGAALLARAQQAGEARPEVAAVELLALAAGIAWVNEQWRSEDPGRVDRMLTVVLAGLSPTAESDR